MNLYHLVIENRAVKEVDALQGEMLERVVKAISFLKQNPRPPGVKKLFADDGWRRLRRRFMELIKALIVT